MSRTTLRFALLATLLMAAFARADSDGYYCAGPDFIAWQIRFDAADLAGPHVVRAVRFGSAGGFVSLGEVVLEDFQPHELSCKQERILLGGWATMPVEYEIAVAQNLRIVRHERFPDREFSPPAAPPSNLGNWSQPGEIVLLAEQDGTEVRLVTTRSSEPREGGIVHRHRAELQRVARDGEVTDRRVIFDGERLETVD